MLVAVALDPGAGWGVEGFAGEDDVPGAQGGPGLGVVRRLMRPGEHQWGLAVNGDVVVLEQGVQGGGGVTAGVLGYDDELSTV